MANCGACRHSHPSAMFRCRFQVQTSFGHQYESLLDNLLQWRPSNRYNAKQAERTTATHHDSATPAYICFFLHKSCGVVKKNTTTLPCPHIHTHTHADAHAVGMQF